MPVISGSRPGFTEGGSGPGAFDDSAPPAGAAGERMRVLYELSLALATTNSAEQVAARTIETLTAEFHQGQQAGQELRQEQ